jgi:Tol biopolymer transport system component
VHGDFPGDLFTVRLDGSHLRRLITHSKHHDETDPVFSPNGRWIVFKRSTNGGSSYQIYVIRAMAVTCGASRRRFLASMT